MFIIFLRTLSSPFGISDTKVWIPSEKLTQIKSNHESGNLRCPIFPMQTQIGDFVTQPFGRYAFYTIQYVIGIWVGKVEKFRWKLSTVLRGYTTS